MFAHICWCCCACVYKCVQVLPSSSSDRHHYQELVIAAASATEYQQQQRHLSASWPHIENIPNGIVCRTNIAVNVAPTLDGIRISGKNWTFIWEHEWEYEKKGNYRVKERKKNISDFVIINKLTHFVFFFDRHRVFSVRVIVAFLMRK